MEIERKWLVGELPVERPRKHRKVETVYLWVTDESEIRISRRQKVVPTDSGYLYGEPRYKVTIKFGNGLSREEHEIFITEEQYNHLKASLPFTPITKEYYQYPLNDGHLLEVSEVDGKWCYAEVEFASEEEAKAWQPIAYLVEHGTEVTGNPDYAMKNYWRRQHRHLVEEDNDEDSDS